MRSILAYLTHISVIVKICQLSFVDCCTDSKISPNYEASRVMETGAGDFADIRHKPAYVDKTMLIPFVLRNDVPLLLAAPRRSGKSINISMLKRFFEILPSEKDQQANRKLFENTLIEQCNETMDNHFGKYPVIFLNFVHCYYYCDSFDEAQALRNIRTVVHNAYEAHSYLITSGKLKDSETLDVADWCDGIKLTLGKTAEELEIALSNLAKYLFKHWGRKVVVLIDDYDNINKRFILKMRDCVSEKEQREREQQMEDIINLSAGMIGCHARCEYVERVVSTGISHIMTTGLSNGNNMKVYRFQEDHDFSKYYGLSHTECRALLEKLGRESEYDDLISFYNGYRHEILSITSVMHFLTNTCTFSKYPSNSGIPKKIDEALRIDEIKLVIIKLLANFRNTVKIYNPVEIEYLKKISPDRLVNLVKTLEEGNRSSIGNVDIYLNFILEQGYVAISAFKSPTKIEIRIPNRELGFDFEELLPSNSLVEESSSIFNKFDPLADDNEHYIWELYNNLLKLFMEMALQRKNIDEADFRHSVYLMAVYSNYKFGFLEITIKPSRFKIDVLILSSKNVLFILELKYKDIKHAKDVNNDNADIIKNAEAGLHQILDRDYLGVINDERYIPKGTKIDYYVLAAVQLTLLPSTPYTLSCISMSVLLNTVDYSKRINFPHRSEELSDESIPKKPRKGYNDRLP